MNTNDIFQLKTQLMDHYVLLIALMLLLVFIMAIVLNRKKIKNSWLRLKTRSCLKHLGIQQLSNIQFPDGMGHYFTVDRLIMRHDGISLLLYNRYPGKIFCADNIDDWTQMLGRKSYRFRNPLHELDNQVKAISSYIPEVAVNGFLFFEHMAEFPKGHPDRVIYLDNIPQQLTQNKQNKVEKPVKAAWEKLVTRGKR